MFETLIDNQVLLIVLFLTALALFIISLIWMISILRKPTEKTPNLREAARQGVNANTALPPISAGSSFLHLVDAAGHTWPLDPLPVHIGRDAQRNQIILVDDQVSSTHARIYYDEILKAICIKDDASMNGIYIDEHPTLKNILRDGVKIRLGRSIFTYRDMGYIPPASNGLSAN